MSTRLFLTTVLALGCVTFASGQTAAAPGASPISNPSAYVLGPGDQISVFVQDMPEEFSNKVFRVDTNGEVSLPVIGHLHAGGRAIGELESECQDHLKHLLNKPQIAISVVNFGSQPISVLGAVNSPGMRQLEGSKTLFEVLSLAGGLRPDAGYEVHITRSLKWGAIPLPQAKIDRSSRSSIASVPVKDLIDTTDSSENIEILPGDAISVPHAQLVYVIGSVTRSGGFALNDNKSISALQAISLAEGLSKTAASSRAKILRTVPDSPTRLEIAVNIKKLLSGSIPDIPLQPNDILFVPNSNARVAGQRTIDVLAGAAGAAIWHF